MRGQSPKIYIPTYGRVGRQPTWGAFPANWKEETVLVCRPEEAEPLLSLGARVAVCPERGIAHTRQWIIDQHEGDRLLMFDDDLKFAFRRTDEPTKFHNLDGQPGIVGIMLDTLWAALDDFHVVGLASRSGANRVTDTWRFNERTWDVMGLRLDTAREHGFRYRQQFMEDFDIHLQYLTHGYPSALLNSFTKDDFGSNTEGGCSTYRDDAGQAAAALDLALEWDPLVKVRQAKGWAGQESRTDVLVYWKKAYEAGVKWRQEQGIPLETSIEQYSDSGLL